MSTTYTPTTTGDPVESYTVPADGDAPDAASVNVSIEGLADDVARTHRGGALVLIEDRALPMIWDGIRDTGAADYWAATNYGGAQQIPAPTGALTLTVHLTELPHGATVEGIALVIDPAAHGAAPANLPSLSFVRVNASTGATTTIGSATDVWNAGAYPTVHPLAITTQVVSPAGALAEVIDLDLYRYVLIFQSEYGANSQANLVAVGPTWSGTARALHVNEAP